MSIFEQASRAKLRFESNKGSLTVEDLWDLPLSGGRGTSLDSVCVGLHQQLQDTPQTLSFVEPSKSNAEQAELQLKFAVAKHILDVRMAELAAAKDAAKRREQRQRILQIIDAKEGAALEGKSVEELRALLADS